MPLDPAMYSRVFEGHHEGKQVLDELVSVFGGKLFVRGGEDGRRQTDYNLGARSVLDFICNKINQANGVEDDGTSDD